MFKTGAGYLIFSKILLGLIRVFEIPVFNANLGEQFYALWLAFFAGNALIAAGGIGIIPIITNQTLIENGDRDLFNKYLSNTLASSSLLIVVLSAVQTIIIGYSFNVGLAQLLLFFGAYIFSAISGLLVSVIEGVAKVEDNYKSFSIFSIYYSIIPSIVTFFAVYFLCNLEIALMIFILAQFVVSIIFFTRMKFRISVAKIRWRGEELKFFISGVSHQMYAVIQGFMDVLVLSFITYNDEKFIVVYASIKLVLGFLRQIQNSIIRANSRELSKDNLRAVEMKRQLNKLLVFLCLGYVSFLMVLGDKFLFFYVGRVISELSLFVFAIYGSVRFVLHQSYIFSHYRNDHLLAIVLYGLSAALLLVVTKMSLFTITGLFLFMALLEALIIMFNGSKSKIFGIDLRGVS